MIEEEYDPSTDDDEEVVGLLHGDSSASSPLPTHRRRNRSILSLACVVAFGLVFLVLDNSGSSSTTDANGNNTRQQQPSTHYPSFETTTSSETTTTTNPTRTSQQRTSSKGGTYNDNDDNDDELLAHYTHQLQPRKLRLANDTQMAPHQFLHLHHMKTGGTSLDGLIQCGLRRLQDSGGRTAATAALTVPYANIHECGESHYKQCAYGDNPACRHHIGNASVLSYCAPLQDVQPSFTWGDTASAVTVLRHPVGRVWSMFRFQTKSCFKCKPLLEIYQDIEREQSGEDVNATSYMRDLCKTQLLNHQTRNVLQQAPEGNIPTTPAHAEEALRNIQSFFTLIGLTEDMPMTARMVAKVFPWLAPQIDDWNDVLETTTTTMHRGAPPFTSCTLQHKNASPKNNRCAPDNKHWDLPDTPDAETAAMIVKHNQLDIQLYERGVELFAVQKKALGLE